jgi:hypothetical protein
MLFYAPEGLRRWRRMLTPLLGAMTFLAVVAIVALPPEPPARVFAAAGAGILAAALAMLLLNGEPLPQGDVFTPAILDPAGVIEFPSHVTVASARKAYKDFWLRSARELRLGSIVMPPVFFAIAALALAKAGQGTAASFFLLFSLMSILSPLGSYLKGRRITDMQALALPRRTIRVGGAGIAIGSTERALAWSSVARVWEFDDHLTLVLHPLVGIQIPKADIPPAARALIAASAPPPS